MKHHIQESFIVPDHLALQRIDLIAVEFMPEYSRSRIQGWIKSGDLKVNGVSVKPKDKVMARDEITLDVELEPEGDWEAEEIALDIVYEDEHILVINKPADLVVHPAPGHRGGTIVNAVLHHCPELEQIPRAGVVHRLDKDTSGLMVIAKSLLAHQSLVNQLQIRSMGREYEAVVKGELTGGGMVDEPIARNPHNRQKMAIVASGKKAVTHYRILQRFNGFTHLRLKLETGRTHQIRVHMAHINHGIVGDPVYGGRPRLPKGMTEHAIHAVQTFPRQALHAKALQLVHPKTGESMSWEVELPADMLELIESLKPDNQD
ncbi:23S rRNA pseudouridine(1911/1915/1917) synthase [Hahella sp. CCB-MM4]|uniref:23S rRNA pseudouridine(1911/1915/1917) synthase RluD n=1 Tax=Hahella sp. (strain CCB-MM4) TaxID=1926491 RepID=UPI000B9B3A1B|nr:23S rRNA pseudouridine(1911/1915/1917) synthase RluD [Hahella sp. CCB-MM4]OZG71484.1 23S rRNA pseudouridine(1911/1915/1917) synthase [Hahella sp. CCB-MM4]